MQQLTQPRDTIPFHSAPLARPLHFPQPREAHSTNAQQPRPARPGQQPTTSLHLPTTNSQSTHKAASQVLALLETADPLTPQAEALKSPSRSTFKLRARLEPHAQPRRTRYVAAALFLTRSVTFSLSRSSLVPFALLSSAAFFCLRNSPMHPARSKARGSATACGPHGAIARLAALRTVELLLSTYSSQAHVYHRLPACLVPCDAVLSCAALSFAAR